MAKKLSKSEEEHLKKKELLSFAQNLVETGKKIKVEDEVMDNFKRSVNYFKGLHAIKRRHRSKGNQVWNKFANIFSVRIAHITSQAPKYKYRPTTEEALFTSDMLNQFLGDILWEKDEWPEKGEDSLTECAHAGSGFLFSDVDDEGWATHEHLNIGAVLWDKQRKHKDLKWIIKVIKKGTKEIKDEFGVEVVPETSSPELSNRDVSYPEVTAANPHKSPHIEKLMNTSRETATDLLGEALIYEIWLKDNEKEKVPFNIDEVISDHEMITVGQQVPQVNVSRFAPKETLDKIKKTSPATIHEHQNHPEHIINHLKFRDTLEPDSAFIALIDQHIEDHLEFEQNDHRPKYPFGRRIAYVQDELLYDKPNTMPINWIDRFIKWDWEKIPGEYIGKNLGCDLFDPQDAFNHRKNSITQNINMLNNGIVKVMKGAYKHLKAGGKLSNLIGAVVEVQNKDDLTVDYGEGLPQSTFSDLGHSEVFMDDIGGREDVAQGRNPAAGTPNAAIENLIGQFNTSISGAVRHYAFALQKAAKNSATIMKEYLPDETVIALADKKDIVEKQWGEIKQFINEDNIIVDLESFGSGTTRQEKVKEAVMFYKEGIFPLRKHVLMYLDNPDKYQIIEDGDELDALRQQVTILTEELDEADKEINTMKNRLQSGTGEGNVGTKKAS